MLFLQGTRDEFAELSLLEPPLPPAWPTHCSAASRWRQSFLARYRPGGAHGRRHQAELADALDAWDGRNPREIGPVSASPPNWTPHRRFTITATRRAGFMGPAAPWPR